MTAPSPRRLTPRPAFTLVELLVALVIGGLVMALALGTLTRQLRTHARLATSLATRTTLAQAGAMLALELRALAPLATDFTTLADTALDALTPLGASVSCRATPTRLELPPSDGDPPLTHWRAMPDETDVTLAFIPQPAPGRWVPMPVIEYLSAPAADACPPREPLAGAAAAPRTVISLAPPLPDSLVAQLAGAPLRVFRRTRFSVYRAADGHWWLGARRCPAGGGVCSGLQPAAGPFAPYHPDPTRTGLRLTYHAADGSAITLPTDAARLARVDVLLRSPADPRGTPAGDSLLVRAALRDRP
ncbi:MAG TPA: type II secretion system protein [Gemmatimonadaceae bacterium]|nr:type II secretion system protein [Gemmatimonadaceae bacterium]